jgi:hypothetical protein
MAGLAMAASLGANARAGELIVNGGFETGDLTGWTVVNQTGGSGSWFVNGNGGGSPLNGFPTPVLAGGGAFNAQTDQFGPGSHQLEQSFVGVAGETYGLSFDVYAIDQSGLAPVGVGLDFTAGVNQHSELNLYGPFPSLLASGNPGRTWQHLTYDLTPLIKASGVYTLSFGEVDNQYFYNLGIDNVSLVSSGGVPEPATWTMMLAGFFGLGATLRARKTAVA